MNDNIYFALKPGDQTANVLLQKADSWQVFLNSSGYLEKLRNAWRAYYGAYFDDVSNGHQVSFSGEQGELVNLPINHFRNLASNIITMTTSNRPAMDARAMNTDNKSIIQAKLANGILDYYLREKKLEKFLKRAVELSVVMGAGFIKAEWNATGGAVYDYFDDEITGKPDPQRPIYEGDIEFTTLSPFDVIMDGSKEGNNHDWYLVRTFKNKYDLAAKYPDLADKIIGLASKSDYQKYQIGLTNPTDETDDVPIYEFYHKKTDAMPNGRYMLFCSQETIMQDIGLPYRTLPIFRISAGDILGTPYGYTPMFDFLPIQEAINTLYSSVLTNQSAFGVQNIWTKPNSNLNVTNLSGGMNHIESEEKPEPLNLTQTPKELFDFIQMLEKVGETLTGVNSVARGNPEASLRTGAALALVQSMALQFNSGLQEAYIELIEDMGTSIIQILQDYAKTPRLIAIVGKENKTKLKEFEADDISNIVRVYVDVGNPLAKTIAGRMELASNMMQYGGLNDPKQIFQVLNTGVIDDLDGAEEDELNLIKLENENMMDGEVPPVMITDEHIQHIHEHKRCLQDPELRKDAGLVQRVTQHLQAHIQALETGNPQLLQALGQQPIAPPGQPAPPPGQQPPPQQGPMPPPNGAPPQGPPGGPQGQPQVQHVVHHHAGPPQPHKVKIPPALIPPSVGQSGIAQLPGAGTINGPGLPPGGIQLAKLPKSPLIAPPKG
jgi:hypothetical protein